jgi:4'-phosphopantetheinyl transferase
MMRIACAYYSDTRALDETQIDALAKLLSRAEIERRDRLLRPHDRRDYTAAHGLLRVTLAAILDKAPEELTFASAKNGKPFLVPANGEAPPSFSLAHSRGLVACAIVPEGSVGIDVEPVDDSVDTAGIATRYFSADESAALQRYPAHERASRFCELWTLKEAFLKAVGTGLASRLDCVSFHVDGSHVRMTQHPPLTKARWAFVLMNVCETHKLAVAIDDTDRRPRVRVMKVDLHQSLPSRQGLLELIES